MEEIWHSSGHLLSLNMPYPHLIVSNLVGHPLHPTMISSTGMHSGVTAKFFSINVQVHMKPFRTLRRDCMTSPALCTRSIVMTVMPAM